MINNNSKVSIILINLLIKNLILSIIKELQISEFHR